MGSTVVAVKAPRCNCFGSDCKPVADGQHKAHCNKATKTQRFINSLQQFEEAIGALYGVLHKEDMLYSEAKAMAQKLEKIRDEAVRDWEGDEEVVRCVKADSEYLDKCDQYFVGTVSTGELCDKCRKRQAGGVNV